MSRGYNAIVDGPKQQQLVDIFVYRDHSTKVTSHWQFTRLVHDDTIHVRVNDGSYQQTTIHGSRAQPLDVIAETWLRAYLSSNDE